MYAGRRCAFASIALLLTTVAGAAGPRSIFDDDWTPPKASETPRPAQPAASDPTTTVKPAPTPTDPNPGTPATPTATARRAVPAKPEQAAVRKVMKEIYAEQIADRSVPARRKLTETLIGQADKSASTPVDQFVLLAAAIDAGVDAADLPLAFAAADRMAGEYDVDALAVKTETVARLNPRTAPPESAVGNVGAGLEVADKLVAADDYAAAARLCGALQSLAAVSADLRAQVQGRIREVGVARAAYEKVARDAEKLRASPDDPAANLSVGRHACFIKGDWRRGLPMLGKGSDPSLKALAALELAGASSPDAVVRLADGWWDAAAKQVDARSRAGAMAHAAVLYGQAVEKIGGLRRVQIEKRIADASKASIHASPAGGAAEKWIDLAELIDPVKHAKAGNWKLENGVLTSNDANGARIQIPYLPPEEYDFRIVFSRNEGSSAIVQFASRQDQEMIWCIGWRTTKFALNEKDIDQPSALKNGRKETSVIKVRKGSVQFLLNDKLILEEKDEARLFDPGTWYALADKRLLGVGSHFSPTSFYSIEILEVSGRGRRLAR
jgi:hypothetical protein